MNRVVLMWIIISTSCSLFSQGCSDAGGCSVGQYKSGSKQDHKQISIGYEQTIGLADKQSLVSTSLIAVSQTFFRNTTLEFKLPYQLVYGNLGFNSGVGDMMISASQFFSGNDKFSISVVLAGKLKSNNANAQSDEQPLPMVYQTSLGTNDIIGGILTRRDNWGFGMIYQHPFGRNDNEYTIEDIEFTPENKQYYESAKLKRGDDLIFRIQKTINLNPGNKLTIGSIPIFRMQKSIILKENHNQILEGTNGLTLNLFFSWNKKIDTYRSFSLTGGFPLVDRDYRPDGLTRTFTITAGYHIFLHYPVKKTYKIDNLFIPLHLN